jgi:type I restriction enzyme S subunit
MVHNAGKVIVQVGTRDDGRVLGQLGSKLDEVIAKKRDLKQAVMQELLTGRTRLPGFTKEWAIVSLISVLERPATYGIVKAGSFRSEGIPMVRGGDIHDGRIERFFVSYFDPRHIPLQDRGKSFAINRFRPGDV